jgi:hypothetical protein
MWVNQKENKSVNFVAPDGLENDQNVLFPAADTQSPDAAATLALTIKQQVSIVNVGAMAADMTVNLTVDAQVTAGAILILKLTSDTTARAVTPGTGFTAPVVAGVISKTKYATYIYTGSTFVPVGLAVQVN